MNALARDDPNFRTLWEESYIVETHMAITQSSRHSFYLSCNNVLKHTLFKPCPSNTFTKLDASIADDDLDAALTRGFREAPTMLTAANRSLHDRILYYISNQQKL